MYNGFFSNPAPLPIIYPRGFYTALCPSPHSGYVVVVEVRSGAKLSEGLHRTEDAGLDTRTRLRLDGSCPSFAQQPASQPPFCYRSLGLQKNLPAFSGSPVRSFAAAAMIGQNQTALVMRKF